MTPSPLRRPSRRPGLLLLGLLTLLSRLAPDAVAAPAPAPPAEVDVPALIPGDSDAWWYASIPGVEVLALAPEDATRTYVENIALQQATLAAIIPADFRVTWSRPINVVLYGSDQAKPLPPAIAPILSKKLTERARELALENREPKPLDIVASPRIQPSTWVPDADSIVIFNVLDAKIRASDLSAAPAPVFVAYLLAARNPPVPAWLRDGVTFIYAQSLVAGSEMDIPPFIWISGAETRLMLKDRRIVPEMVPMSELFAYIQASDVPTDERKRQALRSQASLFYRWALDGRTAGGTDAYWKFARAAMEGGADEQAFRTAFGVGFAEALESMRSYLPTAMKRPVRVRIERPARPDSIGLRRATPSEVARIRGEWERLAGRLVGSQHPELRPYYDARAQRTVTQGPDDAAADPELLAARGLMAVEAGDDAAAYPLLERACAAERPRARAVVELARLRLARAVKAASPGAKLDDATVATIVDPVRAIIHLPPVMPRAYQILAETWSQASTPPGPKDLELLAHGVRLYPVDATMIVYVARLMIDVGAIEQARSAIAIGLDHVTDDAGRRRLFATQSALRAAGSK